jgi:D-serine deaminase-like pyridoxal phosphate-dependent protein
MRSVHDLETPAVIVDLDVLERNILRMAEQARLRSVRLRPHAKTHKILEIGRLQLEAGACGLSLAKTGEAEVFGRGVSTTCSSPTRSSARTRRDACSRSPRAPASAWASTASRARGRSPRRSIQPAAGWTWC